MNKWEEWVVLVWPFVRSSIAEVRTVNELKLVIICTLGKACRSKVTSYLNKRFRTPLLAEKHFADLLPEPMDTNSSQSSEPAIAQLPQSNLVELSHMFEEYVCRNTDCSIPGDFLLLTVEALKHLRANGRSNVIYTLAKGLGTMRPDASDSLFPAKRMPMGLIEYNVNFFTSYSINQVRARFLFVLSLNDTFV